MKLIQKIALLIIVAPTLGLASPIKVGSTTIEVPVPRGFALVIPEMTQVSELQKHFTPPTNEQFAAFIAESDVPQALAGEIPRLQRRFTVQSAKSLVDRPVTQAEFVQLKRTFASDNERMFEELRNKLPDLMSKASKGVSDQLDTQLVIEIGGIVPFPSHYEDERSLSSSMIARNEFTSADGEALIDVIAATMTLIHVKDRVLFIYAYGSKDDLDWTREASKEWIKTIVSANASNTSANPSSQRSRNSSGGINWDRVVSKAIGGAFIGLIIAFISWLVGRRKQS